MTDTAVRVPIERDVKRAVIDTYRQFGCVAWNLDQGFRPGGGRHGTTRQTKGLADVYVTFPRRRVAWWHEAKRPGGAQRPEQADFERAVVACGTAYALGGVGAALLALRDVAGLQVQVQAIHLVEGDRLTLPDPSVHR
jgi:hypothetical protein